MTSWAVCSSMDCTSPQASRGRDGWPREAQGAQRSDPVAQISIVSESAIHESDLHDLGGGGTGRGGAFGLPARCFEEHGPVRSPVRPSLANSVDIPSIIRSMLLDGVTDERPARAAGPAQRGASTGCSCARSSRRAPARSGRLTSARSTRRCSGWSGTAWSRPTKTRRTARRRLPDHGRRRRRSWPGGCGPRRTWLAATRRAGDEGAGGAAGARHRRARGHPGAPPLPGGADAAVDPDQGGRGRPDLGLALVVDAELFRLDAVIRWLDAADGRLKRAAADAPGPCARAPCRAAAPVGPGHEQADTRTANGRRGHGRAGAARRVEDLRAGRGPRGRAAPGRPGR